MHEIPRGCSVGSKAYFAYLAARERSEPPRCFFESDLRGRDFLAVADAERGLRDMTAAAISAGASITLARSSRMPALAPLIFSRPSMTSFSLARRPSSLR